MANRKQPFVEMFKPGFTTESAQSLFLVASNTRERCIVVARCLLDCGDRHDYRRMESAGAAIEILAARIMAILGIGTDITECLRIAQMIERHGELFISRVYTEHEIGYCSTRKAATQHYAGRWAAKEAVLKAIGTGWRRGISWRDIEVRNLASGAPTIYLRGGAMDVAEEAGIEKMHISISHARSHAVAYAIAEGDL